MKLLLDQNLSRRLLGMLAAEYPKTEHVLLIGMAKDKDTDIWDFAAKNGYATRNGVSMEKIKTRYGGLLKSNWTARRILVPEYTCHRPSVEETPYQNDSWQSCPER